MTDRDFQSQLKGFGLTTAEILYRLPDHQSLIQSYVWQAYDEHPIFPRLNKFLKYWSQNLDGPLFRVTVAHSRLLSPRELRFVDGELKLH